MIKYILTAIVVVAASCTTPKPTETITNSGDTTGSVSPVSKDSSLVVNDTTTNTTLPVVPESLPGCIRELIASFEKAPVQNPPRKIFRYQYKGATVYYVPSVCCDQFSDLYGDDCKLLGHPDGGFSGRGDGKFAGFDREATGEKLVWADTRK